MFIYRYTGIPANTIVYNLKVHTFMTNIKSVLQPGALFKFSAVNWVPTEQQPIRNKIFLYCSACVYTPIR